jgi:prepilin-type N-terminal cleavage/methylation domain-containing protein
VIDRTRRRRPGFTLAEVLVAFAIIAALVAVIVPVVMRQLAAARVNAIVAEMQAHQSGIMLFYRDVGRYPLRLDYLNVIPPNPTALDACSNVISAQNVAKFRGPYINKTITLLNPGVINKYILSTGDSVESVLTRTTIVTVGGSQQVLQILVYGPELDVAQDIDVAVDGVINATGGIIQYVGVTPPEDYIVKWTIPIKNGAC